MAEGGFVPIASQLEPNLLSLFSQAHPPGKSLDPGERDDV
jgi:hypothetical protein